MMQMNIRPGGTAGVSLAYAVGSFADADDSFLVTQLGGESPFGSILASLGSDYAVSLSPDGSGRSMFAGLDITTPLGTGKGWYMRDSESGEVWSPFFAPVCEKSDEHEVAFLPGQVRAFTLKNKIASTLTVATLPDRPLEVWLVRIENRSATERSLTFTTYIEPCVGPGLETSYKDREKLMMMRRPLSSVGADGTDQAGGDMVLFHSSTLTPVRYQTEKSEFIGEGRSLRNPCELDSDRQTGSDGPVAKAVASFTVEIELPIEGEAEFGFCMGVARSPDHALELTRGLSKIKLMAEAVQVSRTRWEELCSAVRIDTQDRSLDALVNTWLPYEAYAGWIRQRTGGVCLDPLLAADALRRFYSFCAAAPDACRESLLSFAAGISAAGTYSPDNDSVVMLPPGELLWLPACAARYVAETGDLGVLDEPVGLSTSSGCGAGPELTLKEHCERILRLRATSAGAGDPMLQRTLETWSMVTDPAPGLGSLLEGAESQRHADRPEHPEERSLPRRVRYLQSISPTLAEGEPRADMERVFGSDGAAATDSGVACLAHSEIVEYMLGVMAAGDGLRLRPKLPDSWDECRITRRFPGEFYRIHVTRSTAPARGTVSIVVDGEPVSGQMIPHFGDGCEHKVEVTMG